ncbi:TIGR03086 family protein [Mycolicibacterium litorale]|nr:TIGR03086 family metal-binding protein [Mycolicibacterium litorale]MCV7415331.1 TIGR03086 family protein [Mycolicibacterium litorale]
MHTNDVSRLHRIAIEKSVDLVSRVSRNDLTRPTPCTDWNLADLLAHMTAQHRGFAAAARGHGADHAVWDPAAVADAVRHDPAGVYAAAAGDVLEAFAVDGVMDRAFALPEFGPDVEVLGAQAIGFHFVDYVVHGWDVARSMGLPFDIPAEVVDGVAPIALAVPDGDIRTAPGSPFAPAVDPTGDGVLLDRVLRHLGRSPEWTP